MKNTDKDLKTKENIQNSTTSPEREGKIYQEDKKYSFRVYFSLQEYEQLLRRALREGSTPETLLARRIAERVRAENP